MTPNAAVIATLTASSELGTTTNASLAPEKNGTNIEGLAVYPSATNPGRLAIGFRNPQSGTRALVVTLLNADAVVGGAPARFGEAILLDLGGLGIRSMAWSEALNAMLVLAGPSGGVGTFALYTWSGDANAAPSRVRDISPPTDGSPEAIVTYPGTKDVQILFDMGDAQVGGVSCKDVADASKRFTDVIVHVD